MASMDDNPKVSDIEKTAEVSSLDADSGPASPASPMTPVALSPMQYRKLIWKLDLHLLPPLFGLWFVSLVDRVNIGNANIQGLQQDLHMNPKSNDFNIALLVVLAGLITMEVPSNYLLKKTSPKMILATESLLLGVYNLPLA
jgi:hypothetical protein